MGEKGYPPALSHVDAPPPLLYAKGRFELADGPIVAMVGACNGSAVGQKLTRQLATELGLEGFVIASGLARGIDTAAHLASLERGSIAVLAGGIDVVYPPENADLQRAIGEQGLLLSERNPGFAPRGEDFLEGVSPEPLPEIAESERERIIGALGPSPVDIYEVARATGIAVRKVHIVLPELDLARKLQRHGQQLVSLIGED
jgi:predicted Rossmann fold nucleotide-binding protein DprA/Smf involved in DNA uptake